MKTWFTSDTHYGHLNIVGASVSSWKDGYRQFQSLDEMNRTIVENINKTVGEDDVLYHLGDWSFGGMDNIFIFRNQIKCKNIHLIYGNHDQHIKKLQYPLQTFSSVQHIWEGKIDGQALFMSHYSHNVWPYSHNGVIHLFGHSHGSLEGKGRSMDIGIDTHPEFRPYSLAEILTTLFTKNIHVVDHHIPEIKPADKRTNHMYDLIS